LSVITSTNWYKRRIALVAVSSLWDEQAYQNGQWTFMISNMALNEITAFFDSKHQSVRYGELAFLHPGQSASCLPDDLYVELG
jgi:hypothetical protein